ncbi:SNF2-related protein [soil metagenome]
MSTSYHAKYFAHELTKRCASDSIGKFAASLADARVDLNPHQVDAALFAFQSPLSRGALLADEVGLGKTIEAGILLSQKWAERKRKLLIIVPSNLRKQWSQELLEKFFIPSVILESKSFNALVKNKISNPFNQENNIVICSYQFARSKDALLKQVSWDLVIIDEAHRLRNVYKSNSRIANAIKDAVADFPKVLLTATPLQNTLLELFGLISLIDDYTFGDIKSFKAQFSNLKEEQDFLALKERLKPVCQRTLRRQVLEYVPYTNRFPITQEFIPSDAEQDLYDLVTDYLQSERLYALPSGQRKLMTLILRRLLASSTYAISGTLGALADKLAETAKQQAQLEVDPEEISPDFELTGELKDEWEEDDDGKNDLNKLTPEQLEQLNSEREKLLEFKKLADSIIQNSKGENLLTALEKGFAKAQEFKAPQKAIIFTESTRTQKYLYDILEDSSRYKGKLVLFNGSNNDQRSREIYKNWIEKHKGTDRVSGSPTADMRAAIVDFFRDEASIMIATEAAAEGINLQFCSLIVNYDLPWNPQRIEQRIGRCHRYGQKFDVVVVNFLNKKNAADQRVFELLTNKFQLFSGVFGVSDEVLGTIESGVDFETRIADILQSCRTEKEVNEHFDRLQGEMETQITSRLRETKQKLLENFDVEVHEKLRLQKLQSEDALDRYEQWLWVLTRHYLDDFANFSDEDKAFVLKINPFPDLQINLGTYKLSKKAEDGNFYRLGHPMAQAIIERCKGQPLRGEELELSYNGAGVNISIVESLRGSSGWLQVQRMTVTTFDTQDHLVLTGCKDDASALSTEQCRRLFMLPGIVKPYVGVINGEAKTVLESACAADKQCFLDELGIKNRTYFEKELDKLERWGEDQRATLKAQLAEYDQLIKEAQRAARATLNMPDKIKREKEKRELFNKRDIAWKEYEQSARNIDKQKEGLIDDVERRLEQQIEEELLFEVHWRVT